MTVEEIKKILGAELVCGDSLAEKVVFKAFASDMMSTVLALAEENTVLITGLINSQAVRTAEMLDMNCLICVRGMIPSTEMVELAEKNGLIILRTEKSMFVSCGLLYENGLGKGENSAR